MDKSFVKNWFKAEYDMSSYTEPPITITLDEINGGYYPRKTSNEFELRSDRDRLKYYSFALPSDIKKVINVLMDYCDKYTDDDIKRINKKLDEYYDEQFKNSDKYEEWHKYWFEPIEPSYYIKQSKCRAGYIYMLRCADKVKIGYSKNVEQRIKQLDVRPFKIELIFKEYNDKAYNIEQEIHKCLEDYREEGEWYSNKITEDLVKDMIQEIDIEMGVLEGK